jgi:DNA-binding NarL/FixJ family response regulator
MSVKQRVQSAMSEDRESETIRVVVIDGQNLFRERVLDLIGAERGLEAVGEGDSIPLAMELIRRLHPHIALIGWSGEAERLGEVFARIKDCSSTTRVIVLVDDTLEQDVVAAIGEGRCCGILSRNASPRMMVTSIRKVHAGELWLRRRTTSEVIRQLAKKLSDWSRGEPRGGTGQSTVLNPREREITALTAQGLENKGIAGRLFITEQALESELERVFEKLGVSDRLELALYAIYHRLYETAEEVVTQTMLADAIRGWNSKAFD